MDLHPDFVEPVTPAVSYNNTNPWKTEDSGYHTSFTPGSVECSEISNENLGHASLGITPDVNIRWVRKYKSRNNLSIQNESSPDSPTKRSGLKRPYQDSDDVGSNSAPTPTTMIAGGIQKLKVSDNNKSSLKHTVSSVSPEYTFSYNEHNYSEYAHALSFPTTPVKKICRSNCKLSPMKRSAKKLDFAIHSLSCASNSLQPVKHRAHSKVVRTIQFKPDQKVDIIRMLYHSANAMPPLHKIFSYLSYEDVFNFKLVSHLWCDIWNQVTSSKEKIGYYTCMKNAKKNQENKEKGLTPYDTGSSQMRSLKEVHNILNTHMVKDTPRSPPGTPRTNKFKKFTKSASMDSRLQLLCVRCAQPAKVTKEISGEEWAECTSYTCSYQFCRSCNCDRHPGKNCIRYDLDGPSPSKRRRNSCAVGSMKSRKNLRRLL